MYAQRSRRREQRRRKSSRSSGREEQRCRFAHYSAYSKYYTCKYSGSRRRKHDTEHRAQSSRAQSKASFSVRIRHRHKRFLCCSQYYRQDHNQKCQYTCYQRIAPFKRRNKYQKTENTIYYGRNTRKGLRGHSNNFYQLIAALCIFNKIYSREYTYRNSQQQRKRRHYQRIYQRRKH